MYTVTKNENGTIIVSGTDLAGNTNSASTTFEIDNTPPVIDLSTDKSIVKQGDTITINAAFSEAVNNVTIQINNSDAIHAKDRYF